MISIGGKYAGIYVKDLKKNDKSYLIAYRDEFGKSVRYAIGKESEGMTKTLALSILSERKNKIRHNDYDSAKDKRSPTLDQLAKLFFRDKKLEFTESSYNREVLRYNNKIKILPFALKRVNKIKKEEVQKFITNMRDKGLKENTVYNHYSLCKRIINHSIKYEYFTGKNIFDTVPLKRATDSQRLRFLTPEEINELYIELSNKKNPHLLNMVRFAINTGARANTILNIKYQDILDWETGMIQLRDFKNRSFYKGVIADKEFLREIQELSLSYNKTDYIMAHNGERYSKVPESISKTLHRLFDTDTTDDKHKVVFHTLRHTFGSLLAQKGVSLYTIQKLMNHYSIEQTKMYSKLVDTTGHTDVLNMINEINNVGDKLEIRADMDRRREKLENNKSN